MRFFWVAAGWCVILASPSAHASPSPGGLSVSLSAEYRSGWFAQEWSAFVALNVPFDRFAAPRAMRADPRWAEGPPKKESEPGPAPPPNAPAAGPAPSASNQPALGGAAFTARLAHGTVRHALATAGFLEARSRLFGLASRARSSAVLPELGVRTLRSSGQLLRLAPTVDDPNRYTQAGTSELTIEARLTWHLDRLVFADEEVSLERLQVERDAAERRLIDYVLERLELWQRGRVRSADPNTEPEQRDAAALSAATCAVELDVLTDGWFSQAIGESEAGTQAKVANPGESR